MFRLSAVDDSPFPVVIDVVIGWADSTKIGKDLLATSKVSTVIRLL